MSGPAFPVDDNTFILNGQMRSPLKLICPSDALDEEETPTKPQQNSDNHDPRGHDMGRLWGGVGLWVFVVLSAAVAIPICVGAIAVAIKAKPAPATVIQPAPIAAEATPAAGPASLGDTLSVDHLGQHFVDQASKDIPATWAPNVIDDVRRFAATVALPSTFTPPEKISRSPPKRIIPHRRAPSKPEEPLAMHDASLGYTQCPLSVCPPWSR